MVECPGHNDSDRHGRYCVKMTSDCLYQDVIDVATKTQGSFDFNEIFPIIT